MRKRKRKDREKDWKNRKSQQLATHVNEQDVAKRAREKGRGEGRAREGLVERTRSNVHKNAQRRQTLRGKGNEKKAEAEWAEWCAPTIPK